MRFVPRRIRSAVSAQTAATALLLASIHWAAPASAQIDTHGDLNEVVAQPVAQLSTAAAPAAAHDGHYWNVVYASGGEIWCRSRDALRWGTPVPLSASSGTARDPHAVWTGNELVVVWEDARSGHPEIWSRWRIGTVWLPEVAVTDDAVSSRRPALACYGYDDPTAYLVWEEGAEGSRTIRGRLWQSGVWGSVEDVANGPGEACEPSVCVDRWSWRYVIVWTDLRHDFPQIYL